MREDNFTPDDLQDAYAGEIARHPRHKPSAYPCVYAVTQLSRRYPAQTLLVASSRKSAFHCVKKYGPSTYECINTFLVVEKIPLDAVMHPGTLPEAYWYMWKYASDISSEEYEKKTTVEKIRHLSAGGYVPIKTPAFYKEVVASIGY